MSSVSEWLLQRRAVAVVVVSVVVAAGCGGKAPTSPSAPPASPSTFPASEDARPSASGAAIAEAGSHSTRADSIPPPPRQEAPSNGATDLPATVTVRWHAATSSNPQYIVQIAADASFSSLVANARITDGSIGYTVFNLAGGHQYFWRVAVSVGGSTSPWSPVWSFRITSRNPPAVPTLISPANGATGVSRSPTLAWNPVPGAESYQVEISPFATAYFNVQGTSITISEETLSLGYTDRHVWRVRAKNVAGTSDWSDQWVFTRTP
jgi:hypothetical protein